MTQAERAREIERALAQAVQALDTYAFVSDLRPDFARELQAELNRRYPTERKKIW